jgi:hypothetical protein
MNNFIRGYMDAMFWTEEAIIASDCTMFDLAKETQQSIESDCDVFLSKASEKEQHLSDSEQAGHDFWLTRNRHGAGFWDGDYPDDIGDTLTELSQEFKEVSLYVGDDNLLYLG